MERMASARPHVTASDHSRYQLTVTGIADKQGKTIAVYSRQPDLLTLQPHIEQVNRECLNVSYWDDETELKIDFSRTDKKDDAK